MHLIFCVSCCCCSFSLFILCFVFSANVLHVINNVRLWWLAVFPLPHLSPHLFVLLVFFCLFVIANRPYVLGLVCSTTNETVYFSSEAIAKIMLCDCDDAMTAGALAMKQKKMVEESLILISFDEGPRGGGSHSFDWAMFLSNIDQREINQIAI